MNRGLIIGNGGRLGGLGAFGVRGGGVAVDTTPPTVVITSTEVSPSAANPVPLAFILSEPSTDFTIFDIRVSATGTSLGNFAGSGASYTADVTLTGTIGGFTVDISAGAFHDAAGNANLAATQFSITSALQLLDKFTTNVSAPISSPRNCEPGPGAIIFTDTSGTVSITSSQLVIGAETNHSRGGFSSTVANAAGMAYIATLVSSSAPAARVYWGTAYTNSAGGSMIADTSVVTDPAGSIGAILPTITSGKIGMVRRGGANGCFYLYFNGTNWNLMWVAQLSGTAAGGMTLSAFVNQSLSYDNLQIATLGSPWNTASGIATANVASPGAGATSTAEANAIVEFTFTAQTGVTKSLYVRHTDDDNCYRIDCDQTNSKLFLYRRESGVDNDLSAGGAAQTWTNGGSYRIAVIMTGSTIYALAGTAGGATALKVTATSQTFNQTATGVKVSHAGTNLISWPRVLSGAALSEVQRIYPF